MAKLTVLGVCGAYPKAGGATSSYLLQTNSGKNILIDCGAGAVGRLAKYINLKKLDAVVLSHLHYDHVSDLLPLSYFYQINKTKLNVYMPQSQAPIFEIIKSIASFNVAQISSGEKLIIEGCDFGFLSTIHSEPCLSMKIFVDGKTLFYSGDTVLCDALKNTADADFCILDCGNAEGGYAPHLSISDAATLIYKKNAVKLLSHLNSEEDYSLPHYIKLLQDNNFTLAQELKTYIL